MAAHGEPAVPEGLLFCVFWRIPSKAAASLKVRIASALEAEWMLSDARKPFFFPRGGHCGVMRFCGEALGAELAVPLCSGQGSCWDTPVLLRDGCSRSVQLLPLPSSTAAVL